MHCLLSRHDHVITNTGERRSAAVPTCVLHSMYLWLLPPFDFPFREALDPCCHHASPGCRALGTKKAQDSDNLSPPIEFLSQRSWLKRLSWLGRLTASVVAQDGIQYRPSSHHSRSRVLDGMGKDGPSISPDHQWSLLAAFCLYKNWVWSRRVD